MTNPNLAARIDGIFLGAVAQRWNGRPPSAIAKTAFDGRQDIGALGFTGDEQADPKHPGGRDKAIHHYPTDHYPT